MNLSFPTAGLIAAMILPQGKVCGWLPTPQTDGAAAGLCLMPTLCPWVALIGSKKLICVTQPSRGKDELLLASKSGHD